MSIDTITIAGQRYVVIPEKEFREKFDEYGVRILSEDEMTEQDWGDVAECARRDKEGGPSIPWEQVKGELGLE